ncbi:MAG: transcription termination factor NusA [Candidatus Cloacimonetes bacterium]|nr:transcription termination factor NusA [Candidatus Cloacimonadota bacterium]
MSANIIDAVIKLAAIKQLDKDEIQQIILDSITSTLSKRMSPENELVVSVDENTGYIKAKFNCTIVEFEKNLDEVSLLDAKQIFGRHVKLGELYVREMSLSEFEPKVVKTAQRIILDKIRFLEQERIKTDFDKLKQTIVSGRVKSIESIAGYKVDIGYSEALLPPDEQIDNEFYKVNDMIKAYVVNIRAKDNNVVIILSRTNPEFVKKLFEAEIPEVYNGLVKIRKIVREPGVRTKIELESTDPKIDPISCCVGNKGTRIDSIRRELHGEQIDIVIHSDDAETMIAHALGIETIKRVVIERGKTAAVIVSEEEKVCAIGKQGKNVKLAAKLCGFKLDIYTQDEFEEKMAKERRTISHIKELDGVNAKIEEILRKHGYTSVEDVFSASVDELCNLEGIGHKTAEKLIEAARLF